MAQLSAMDTIVRIRHRLADASELVVLISFLLVFLFFSIRAENFLSLVSLTNILTIASIKGIFVVGVAMLMISGEFDLSVGSILAVATFVFALSLEAGTAPLAALVLALAVSAVLGGINGLIVIRTGIPSFIATLGTMLAFRGIARAIGGADFARFTGEMPALFTGLNGEFTFINRLAVPAGSARMAIIWFLLFAVLAAVVMRNTRFGSWVYATGGSRAAAIAQGVKTKNVIAVNYIVTGLLAGFAGIVQFASRPAVDPLRGEGWELTAVAACVIGGIWLSGGYGTIVGAAVGMLLLQMVEQGLILLGVDVQLFQATIGLILILAVISNTYLSRQ
ncbi:MAG: ABC transporter permease [Caldilineaceae bacterium SB0664_bin_27]|uniref:Xylose transport system permease protein XylH n=1 Tax=Caldilineaceae bacterium SB0664_bin_27 TaxID=2605260 RepID=A0A6B0YYH8_9CHLR|nr:ABC transporter permease [Caldilineaceae bacterium SB0664_bin_27]